MAAALVAGAGVSAWADDAPEEEVVVATDEATFWLGGDEVAVASDEATFWFGPDEITVATDEATFALMSAGAVKVGEDVYAFLDADGTLYLVGEGAVGDSASWPTGIDRDAVKRVVLMDGVTGIGARFFKKCYNLNSFTGGKDLATFGEKAFYLCLSLENIALANTSLDLDESGFSDAIVLQSAIDGEGKVYAIPQLEIPGYKVVLKGTNNLSDPIASWATVDPTKPMQETGYHFFKYVLEADAK